jgi:hypothetical protein
MASSINARDDAGMPQVYLHSGKLAWVGITAKLQDYGSGRTATVPM